MGQHIKEVTCQGGLIAVFTYADYSCRRDSLHTEYEYTSDESCEGGHVCFFTLAQQEPVHIVDYPAWFNTVVFCNQMRYEWSPDSRQLMVWWRNDEHDSLAVACLSKYALAEREVRQLLLPLHDHAWSLL